jgi:hypothetical protein
MRGSESIAVFFLFFLQFGMAFHPATVEATTGLCWSMVDYFIVLNVISPCSTVNLL